MSVAEYDNLLGPIHPRRYQLPICNAPDFVGSDGTSADEVAGAEGSEANAQPDDLPPPMSGFSARPHPPTRASTVKRPARTGRSTSQATSHRIVAAPLDGVVVRLRQGFTGVRRAGLEHCKVFKPAHPWANASSVRQGLPRGPPLRPQEDSPIRAEVADGADLEASRIRRWNSNPLTSLVWKVAGRQQEEPVSVRNCLQ